ncbi:uncharacterized protein OCT59_027715 [Rhizophagus irregularis]|uniref:uncharacterized protein n=1 Tax=Rhizophagus irregularis TaxID=588596 RepID=UPI003317409F|nr:hypothetical protein OCT59_027715 [Rhizophagus irregularis]
MAKSNNHNGLNPAVVQALNNLQYKYSGETPEMWCSCVHYPFKKLLEYNPKYFSKNGFIQMIERSYKDGKFKTGRCSFHIYCTVCDSLVIIRENTIECGNDHLKKCIAKTAKRHIAYSNPIQKNVKKGVSSELSDDEIEKIYQIFGFIFMRNDNTPDEKKYLGITPRDIRIPDDQYVNYFGRRILARDVPAHHQNEPRLRDLYCHYTPHNWAENKKDQLYVRLTTVAYIVTFIKSYQQDYRFVGYSD